MFWSDKNNGYSPIIGFGFSPIRVSDLDLKLGLEFFDLEMKCEKVAFRLTFARGV